ncbi:unnamed protein product [Adineta ricciae]|uniref:Uncharacterized protein n=1 Tax=Adineta ricciae TaxID=249248 RepID=A0A815VTS2_ADIRI|nr:unnamed protein product [Adineta ricciae]CAF1648922.1 unnamed protein product [Adineta ricciae]
MKWHSLIDILRIIIDLLNLLEQLLIYLLGVNDDEVLFFVTLIGIGLCSKLLSTLRCARLEILLLISVEIGEFLAYRFLLQRSVAVLIISTSLLSVQIIMYLIVLLLIHHVRKRRPQKTYFNDMPDSLQEKFKSDLCEFLCYTANFDMSEAMTASDKDNNNVKTPDMLIMMDYFKKHVFKSDHYLLQPWYRATIYSMWSYIIYNVFGLLSFTMPTESAFRENRYFDILVMILLFVSLELGTDFSSTISINQSKCSKVITAFDLWKIPVLIYGDICSKSFLACSILRILYKRGRHQEEMSIIRSVQYRIDRLENSSSAYICWQIILYFILVLLLCQTGVACFVLCIIDWVHKKNPKDGFEYNVFLLICGYGILFMAVLLILAIVGCIIFCVKLRQWFNHDNRIFPVNPSSSSHGSSVDGTPIDERPISAKSQNDTQRIEQSMSQNSSSDHSTDLSKNQTEQNLSRELLDRWSDQMFLTMHIIFIPLISRLEWTRYCLGEEKNRSSKTRRAILITHYEKQLRSLHEHLDEERRQYQLSSSFIQEKLMQCRDQIRIALNDSEYQPNLDDEFHLDFDTLRRIQHQRLHTKEPKKNYGCCRRTYNILCKSNHQT